jgi:hypothetical protein
VEPDGGPLAGILFDHGHLGHGKKENPSQPQGMGGSITRILDRLTVGAAGLVILRKISLNFS